MTRVDGIGLMLAAMAEDIVLPTEVPNVWVPGEIVDTQTQDTKGSVLERAPIFRLL